MRRSAVLATSSLSLWAMDFDHNLRLIEESIAEAKRRGARFRTGPELEITSYSCGDHFFESDTLNHGWEAVAELLKNSKHYDILVDVGLPVAHRGVLYNCRLVLLNGKIVLIRPKRILCDSGNYSETRWFTAWTRSRAVEQLPLPEVIQAVTGQLTAPFGDALIRTRDTVIGHEICEELWNPDSCHIQMGLAGAEIFVNSSGSVREMGRPSESLDLIKSATYKGGGCYVFSNLKGTDGDRFVFGGDSCIVVNGELVARQEPFTLADVEVVTAAVDLEEVRVYAYNIRSRCKMGAEMQPFPMVEVDFFLCSDDVRVSTSPPLAVTLPTNDDEVLGGLAGWLWDYLRRSGHQGFLLGLSGGLDSTATAVMVYALCHKLSEALTRGNETVLRDLRRVLRQDPLVGPRQLCHQLLHTLHVAAPDTTDRQQQTAAEIARVLGSTHHTTDLSEAVAALDGALGDALSASEGEANSGADSDGLRGTISRMKMAAAYHVAKRKGGPGGLLVLGCANVDKLVLGACTKYGAGWGDINPVGGVAREDLRGAVLSAAKRFDLLDLIGLLPEDTSTAAAPGTKSPPEGALSPHEVATCARLRKAAGCGPYSMFRKLLDEWADVPPEQVAEKVKFFFVQYSSHRHKVASAPPSVHCSTYDSEDSRSDFRPLLYNTQWPCQFRAIDDALIRLQNK